MLVAGGKPARLDDIDTCISWLFVRAVDINIYIDNIDVDYIDIDNSMVFDIAIENIRGISN